ncbi:hypothetical protein [Mucilaginibacter sp.]
MNSLGLNWFIEGSLDFEHKKYVLLNYLQEINRHFDKSKLYPNLTDLVFHYNNLLDFKQNKTTLQQAFPQRLTKADIEAVKLTYKKIVADDSTMQEIEHIINYAIAKMNSTVQIGREIYDFVESRLNIDPIGLIPLKVDYGYFSLRNGSDKTNWIYEYQLSIFKNKDDAYRDINVVLIDTYEQSITNTLESVKLNLINHRRHLPNPAVYYVQSDISFPLEQTLLPVAKRCLVKYIMAA